MVGFLFSKQAETTWRQPYVIAAMLILVAVVMLLAEQGVRPNKDIGRITAADAVGLAQALAVVPGTSRSGITMAAGLFRDLDHHTAARFSFLLSTPAIAAAAAKGFYELMKHGGIPPAMRVPFIVGILVSGITGALTISLFLTFLRRQGLQFFIYYRFVFGIMVIALAMFFRFTAA